MTMPKKGTRSIIVDDVTYRWRMSRSSRYEPTPAVIVIERNGVGGCTASIELPYLQFDPWLYLGDPGPRPSPALETVSPVDIARYIRLALQAGWNSAAPGIAFNLKISEQESGPSSKRIARKINPNTGRP